MKTASETLKVISLGAGPKYKTLNIDDIVALSGLQTFRGGTLDDYIANGEVDKERIKTIHRESTRRGHASMTTTPSLFFEVEGSRMIDLYGSAFPFGSFIMFSSRRVKVTDDLLVRPDALNENSWRSYKGLLKEYESMWEGSSRDKARKVLPLGFYSHGLMKFSAEDIVHMKKETMETAVPKELSLMADKMGGIFKENAPLLYEAAMERKASLSYGNPNIFHENKLPRFSSDKNVNIKIWKDAHLQQIVNEFKSNSPPGFDDWKKLSMNIMDMVYANAVLSGSIAVWNEVKRHRTIVQKAESVYDAVDRAFDEVNSLSKNETPRWIHIPPGKSESYVEAVHNSLAEYHRLADKIEKRDAIYVVPHCVKIKFSLAMNGFHLVDPFGFLGIRSCTTSDYEVQELARKIKTEVIKQVPALEGLIGPKCKTGVCPERRPCGIVKMYSKNGD